MTLLTGQPQLSMGEFVQAAGAFMGGAMAAKNAASTVTSPAREAAKKKAHDWSEQRSAGTAARQKQEQSMKDKFASEHGIDTSTRSGRKNLEKKWDIYRNSDDRSKEIDSKISKAGMDAADDVKQRQHAEYVKNGGVAGSAGRLLAHYTGAALNAKQTLMQGRAYNIPGSNIDTDRIGAEHLDDSDIMGRKQANPDDENIKKEETKNNLPKDPGVGERQVE